MVDGFCTWHYTSTRVCRDADFRYHTYHTTILINIFTTSAISNNHNHEIGDGESAETL